MTEPLFLMPRYWGSDDSDDEIVDDKLENKSKFDDKCNSKEVKCKKRRKASEAVDSLNENISLSDDNKCALGYEKFNSVNSEESLQNENSSKKKKKHKKNNSVDTGFEDKNSRESISTVVISNKDEIEVPETHEAHVNKKLKKKKGKSFDDDSRHDAASFESPKELNDDEVQNSEAVIGSEQSSHLMFPVMKDMITKDHEKIERILPDWLANPTIIQINIHSKEKNISELEFLDDKTKSSLQACGINYLFPVQEEVIPWLLRCNLNRLIVRPSDLCVSAPTGSGKTLSFVIPIVQSLKIRVVNAIRALIVLPVGDLASQVFKVFQEFCKGTDLQVALAIGQKSFSQEQDSLIRKSSRGYFSNVDIVVSTPGRLIDHINHTPGFSLQKLQYLIIDEADRMMDEIQHGWLKKVETAVHKSEVSVKCSCYSDFAFQRYSSNIITSCSFGHMSELPLQKLLFSATLSQDPEKLHELSLYRPKLFTAAGSSLVSTEKVEISQNDVVDKYVTPESLAEYYVVCETVVKPLVVCHVIKLHKFNKILCFTQSIEHSHRLQVVLSNMLDLTVRELSSSLKPVQRKIILDQFKSGRVSILVCSDLMARGMDICNVDCVISYDMPLHIKTYIHRIGRTARAGKTGSAVTLLDNNDIFKFKKILKTVGKEMPKCLTVKNSDLTSYEDSFKNALSLSSKLISNERKNIFKKNLHTKQSTRKKAFNGYRTSK